MGIEKSRSTSNGDRGEGSADRFEGNHATATKISTSVSDYGDGLSAVWKTSELQVQNVGVGMCSKHFYYYLFSSRW